MNVSITCQNGEDINCLHVAAGKDLRLINSTIVGIQSKRCIYLNKSSSLFLEASTISGCSHHAFFHSSGGGIRGDSGNRVIITNSTLFENKGWHGGCLFLEKFTKLLIINTEMTNNDGLFWGVVYLTEGTAMINNSRVTNNLSTAIQIHGKTLLYITDSILSYNRGTFGAALGLTLSSSRAIITKSIISYNRARIGGAVYRSVKRRTLNDTPDISIID